MTTAAQLREMRRSESCKWFPVSTPRPIMKGVCVMRAYRRAPSGETTSRTASPARGTVSGMGESQCGNCNTQRGGKEALRNHTWPIKRQWLVATMTRTYLINGFVAGKPQTGCNGIGRKVMIWLGFNGFIL